MEEDTLLSYEYDNGTTFNIHKWEEEINDLFVDTDSFLDTYDVNNDENDDMISLRQWINKDYKNDDFWDCWYNLLYIQETYFQT